MKSCSSNSTTALNRDLAAVLLLGGSSRRMGCDKALLCLDGQPVAQLLARRLLELTDQVLLSVSEPSAYDFLGLPAVQDVFQRCGPMAGLHAAMTGTSRQLVMVLACDLPRAPLDLLRHMIACAPGFDAVMPATSDGRLHPVCAIYRRTCLPAIERNLHSGLYQMLRLIDDPALKIRRLISGQGIFNDADLLDMNSPEDFQECARLSNP